MTTTRPEVIEVSEDGTEQDIYGTLGDETDCATCPREAAGERVQALEHPDGGKRAWKIHFCRCCNRAFSLGNGDPPLLSDGGTDRSVEPDTDLSEGNDS